MNIRLRALALTVLLLDPFQSYATPAKVFSIKKANAVEIVSDMGHLDLNFVTGWISSDDALIQKILSKMKKLSANASATGTYFDGDQLKNSWIIENSDVPHKINRSWGAANKPLFSAIPADTLVASFTLEMTATKEDRFQSLIGTFQANEPTTGLSVEPYLTYAKLVDSMFNNLFGTDKTRYPFTLDAGLADDNIKSPNGIYEHYIIAISSNNDKDNWLQQLDGKKLSYDPAGNRLTYNGQQITDHTFAVLSVASAKAPNIPQLLLESKSAWAVLAQTSFYNATLPDINTKDDVPKADKTFVQQLGACIDPLKRELRFSAYDRAVALRAFAERSKQMVATTCAAKNITAADCKTPQIDSFEDGIDNNFQIIHPATKDQIKSGVPQLNQQLLQMFKLQ
jgi:hypothetical protein